MSDYWCLRRGENFSRDELVDVYDKTLADVLQRYDELSKQTDYVSRKKDPTIEHRLLLLEDIILDLYTALRCLK